MGTLEIAYKILYSLETGEKTDYMGKLIGPDALGAEPEKWAEVIASLSEEGYISGVRIYEDIVGNTQIDIRKAKITLKGAEYLRDNSAMAKFRRIATDIITIGSNAL